MKPNLMLVGRVCRDHLEARTVSSQDKTERIKVYVRDYFWCGSIYLHQEDQLNQCSHYPEFFAAGWFMMPADGEVKQSIVVATGGSMADAKQKMLALSQKLDWN